MNNIFTKLRDFVGLNDPVDYDYEYAAKAAMKLQDFDAAKGYYAKAHLFRPC